MNIKNHKTIFGAGLTALAFSTILTSTAQAQTCTTVPSCSTLGYTKSASDCSGLDYLRCPFDQSKYFCTSSSSSSGGGSTPPASQYRGTLRGIINSSSCDCNQLTSGMFPRYEYVCTYQQLECKLPSGTETLGFSVDVTVKTGSGNNFCTDAWNEVTGYQYEGVMRTIGECNSAYDYNVPAMHY